MAEYKCDWCQKEFDSYEKFRGGEFFYNSLELSFGHGQAVPHFPWIYEVAELCNDCREKLYHKLLDMGIKFRKIESSDSGSFTLVNENGEWRRLS